jgi:hypothetical protein
MGLCLGLVWLRKMRWRNRTARGAAPTGQSVGRQDAASLRPGPGIVGFLGFLGRKKICR